MSGVRVLVCAADGPPIAGERDVGDVISAAWDQDAAMVAIPTQRLSDEFFRLKTRVAGELIQKLVNYRLRLAIVGDISGWISKSDALRDFVAEANRGENVWFVESLEGLKGLLVSR